MLLVKLHPLHVFSMSVTMSTLLYAISDISKLSKHLNRSAGKAKKIPDSMPSREEMLNAVMENISPNVPFQFLIDNMDADISSQNVTLPSPFDIKINNHVWQVAEFENDTFLAFGAYFDDRPLALHDGRPLVRILGFSYLHDMDKEINLRCVFWHEHGSNTESLSDQAEVVDYLQLYMSEAFHGIDPKTAKDFLKPYLLSCPLPNHFIGAPIAVSLCDQDICHRVDNCLKVNNERPLQGQKENLAVCVKELEYPLANMAVRYAEAMTEYDIALLLSLRLVEWIELTLSLGASKIFMYEMQVHSVMKKVISYYVQKGKVEVNPYRLAHYQINFPKELLYLQSKHALTDKKFFQRSRHQVVVHTDCLLRNIHKYKHIAVLDIDEVILPILNRNQNDLLHILEKSFEEAKKIEKSILSHYVFKNMYFLESFGNENDSNYLSPPEEALHIPFYLHTMRHVVRSAHPVEPPKLVKSIVDTDQVLAMYQHFPMHCLGGPCRGFIVDEGLAFLAHYRHSCSFMIDDCDSLEGSRDIDTTAWKYQNTIQAPVEEALISLDLL